MRSALCAMRLQLVPSVLDESSEEVLGQDVEVILSEDAQDIKLGF